MVTLTKKVKASIPDFNLPTALEYIGGLGAPSKMPCRSWDIPAQECKTGAKLAEIEGSICSKCYVKKGFFNIPRNQSILYKRLDAIYKPYWKYAMKVAIQQTNETGYFRFFSAGDLQSIHHLKDIIWICEQLPNIKAWMPTKELKIVSDYVKSGGKIPDNLTIRLSGFMIDGPAPSVKGFVTSTVVRENQTCLAPSQGGKCLDCRKCWDGNVQNVSYKLH